MKTTKDFLSEATRLVGNDRQKDYGDKTENHNNIAKLWSAYLDVEISAHDVALMMALLKMARTKLGAVSKDNFILSKEDRDVLLKYLMTRPYAEVAQAINAIMKLPKLDPKISPSFVKEDDSTKTK
jgi:hypothetical protein